MEPTYEPKTIETKWQQRWEKDGTYKIKDLRAFDPKKKCYCVAMFSYPSGDKLHVGHWFNYGLTDSWARFRRLRGYQVFEPMGFDAFGLPAENYAIKHQVHPEVSTRKNIEFMRQQLKAMGAMYDWDYEVVTCLPDYYRWTQWVFLQLYRNKLAYRAKAPVNWCPKCQTVLANEQVVAGACERCKATVVQKDLTQWFFKITAYAQRLLDGHARLDWPEKTLAMQRHWIGRSEGGRIAFPLAEGGDRAEVFTTRPDTLMGVTYLVLAPEHKLVDRVATPGHRAAVAAYQDKVKRMTELERLSTAEGKEKTGVFTGAYANHPLTGERVPIWIADYVLASYGTGAVMAVPGHDTRDWDFARKMNLPIRQVILPPDGTTLDKFASAYTEAGTMVNSGPFNGQPSKEGGRKVLATLQEKGLGEPSVTYRIRDWLLSRQRYWGAPIPIIYCEECGAVPVPEKDLPVKLPAGVDFRPQGESPLARCREFVKVACPSCGRPSRRETDTMDTFVCSSWYFLRYPDARNGAKAFDVDLVNRILPVDTYVGGHEHACGHLIFARFINRALYDMGQVKHEEPFPRLIHQGIILGPDGQRMSKSHGNTVAPEKYIDQYGTDALRCYLMFGFSFRDGGPWNDDGMKGIAGFLRRVWRLVAAQQEVFPPPAPGPGKPGPTGLPPGASAELKELHFVRHRTIAQVTKDLENFEFNTALSRLMELVNQLYQYTAPPEEKRDPVYLRAALEDLILLLAPLAPHLGEEMWEATGHAGTVFNASWPTHDPAALKRDEVELAIQVNGKVREQFTVPTDIAENALQERAAAYGKIPSLLEGKTVVKIVVVKGRLVNIVVK